jgi:hypothetical protein
VAAGHDDVVARQQRRRRVSIHRLEVDPNFNYDPGEDIYDRNYLEIWVYAEGENTSTLFDNNDFAPDREPALRDIGFRVHLNGMRVDDAAPITSTRTISDYDAPGGVQAAAGWGPSHGYVGPSFAPPDPAYGGFNRHYEYRLPRQGGQIGSAQVAIGRAYQPQKPFEKQIVEILPDCPVRITFIWKDIRRNKQGKFVTHWNSPSFNCSCSTCRRLARRRA